jgi:hypothetical protein
MAARDAHREVASLRAASQVAHVVILANAKMGGMARM